MGRRKVWVRMRNWKEEGVVGMSMVRRKVLVGMSYGKEDELEGGRCGWNEEWEGGRCGCERGMGRRKVWVE